MCSDMEWHKPCAGSKILFSLLCGWNFHNKMLGRQGVVIQGSLTKQFKHRNVQYVFVG